jgi:hypothetical protein
MGIVEWGIMVVKSKVLWGKKFGSKVRHLMALVLCAARTCRSRVREEMCSCSPEPIIPHFPKWA